MTIDNLSLTNYEGEGLELIVWSAWDTSHLNRDIGAAEIRKGKDNFERLCEQWPDLQTLILGQTVPCFLHYDYGTGSVRICELKEDDNIEWVLPELQ